MRFDGILGTILVAVLCAAVFQVQAASSKADGADVYAKQCAACHDSGAARTPTKKALQDLEAETIVHALESGVDAFAQSCGIG